MASRILEEAGNNLSDVLSNNMTAADSVMLPSNSSASRASDSSPVYPELSANVQLFFAIEKIIVPALCIGGIVGNACCLFVLTRQRLRSSVQNQERVVHVGLLSMSVSDTLFCLAMAPRAFVAENSIMLPSGSFPLYYQLYSNGLLTTFSLVSTWLIVVTAGIRYLGICHPLRARYLVRTTGIYIAITLICVLCVGGNMPSFWLFTTIPFKGDKELIDLGPFSHQYPKGIAFLWLRNILGVIVPGLLLGYFNIRLILALQASKKLRQQTVRRRETLIQRCHSQQEGNRNRLTWTLVAVVVIFVVLVFPCEIMDIVVHLGVGRIKDKEGFIEARALANLLQVCNFAFNFVVYCILSATFRRTTVDCCHEGMLSLCSIYRRRVGRTPDGPREINMLLKSSARTTNNSHTITRIRSLRFATKETELL